MELEEFVALAMAVLSIALIGVLIVFLLVII
jgi:hypothetical protein